MASQLHITCETADASALRPLNAAVASLHRGLASRLEGSRPGRALLGCLRWGVVFGLVLSGYVGAGAINAGIEIARSGAATATATAQPLLAASK